MAPVVLALEQDSAFESRVCVTGQHRQCLIRYLNSSESPLTTFGHHAGQPGSVHVPVRGSCLGHQEERSLEARGNRPWNLGLAWVTRGGKKPTLFFGRAPLWAGFFIQAQLPGFGQFFGKPGCLGRPTPGLIYFPIGRPRFSLGKKGPNPGGPLETQRPVIWAPGFFNFFGAPRNWELAVSQEQKFLGSELEKISLGKKDLSWGV